jgi:hypothetical protein
LARDLQDRLGILALSAFFRICKLQIPLATRETDPVYHRLKLNYTNLLSPPLRSNVQKLEFDCKRPSNRMVERVQWLSWVTSIGRWPLRWGKLIEAVDGVVSESWPDRCQVVADRQPESAAALDDGDDGGNLWASLCAAEADPAVWTFVSFGLTAEDDLNQ